MLEKLSVRCYALIEYQEKILLIREDIKGTQLYKFPGGGLEIGEGIGDCMSRELYEELGSHFPIPKQARFIPNNLIPSAFMTQYQVLPIYFHIAIDPGELPSLKTAEEVLETRWVSPDEAKEMLMLKSDKDALEHIFH